MLFQGDYQFKGSHAEKVNRLTAAFGKGNNKLFNRNLDVYILAPIVGFLNNRTASLDTSGNPPMYCTMPCPKSLTLFGSTIGSSCSLTKIKNQTSTTGLIRLFDSTARYKPRPMRKDTRYSCEAVWMYFLKN